jgi:hypothetical protein
MELCKPRQDLITIKSQEPSSLEVRNSLDRICGIGPRGRSWALSVPSAARPAQGTVACALINPRLAHVQQFSDLRNRQNLRNHHRETLFLREISGFHRASGKKYAVITRLSV